MQVKHGHSLDMQCKLIADHVQSKGWMLSDLFCETAQSGRLTDRPALKMMLARAKRGKFDVIVVTSFDRFHRNLLHLLLTLDQLHQWNIAFVSITENIDFTTSWGKVALAVLGSLAEIYCDKLSIETKRGKQGRVLKGLWNGSIPFGYCNGLCSMCTDVNGLNYCPEYGQANRGNGRTLIFHPIESIGVRLSFDWYYSAKYIDGVIAEKLNGYVLTLPDGSTRHFRTKRLLSRGGPQPFTRDSVREMLMRVFYTGHIPYFGTTAAGIRLKRHDPALLHSGTHLALISIEVFGRCQEIRRKLARRSGTNLHTQRASFPLSGILFCDECGGHMIGGCIRGERRYHYNARIQHRVRCSQPSVPADLVETPIVQMLSNLHWTEDWREQWQQALESAWDKRPVLSNEMEREKFQEAKFSGEGYVGMGDEPLLLSEQAAKQRWFEIEQLIETMEPLSAFHARWEIAASLRDHPCQKQLLRAALTRIVVRGFEIVEIEASPTFAHLLQNTQVAKTDREIPEAQGNKLIGELLVRSSR
jgi:DNA invertase Pin-like site-specific DNA recombinase